MREGVGFENQNKTQKTYPLKRIISKSLKLVVSFVILDEQEVFSDLEKYTLNSIEKRLYHVL